MVPGGLGAGLSSVMTQAQGACTYPRKAGALSGLLPGLGALPERRHLVGGSPSAPLGLVAGIQVDPGLLARPTAVPASMMD
jgi:hypothetical protein